MIKNSKIYITFLKESFTFSFWYHFDEDKILNAELSYTPRTSKYFNFKRVLRTRAIFISKILNRALGRKEKLYASLRRIHAVYNDMRDNRISLFATIATLSATRIFQNIRTPLHFRCTEREPDSAKRSALWPGLILFL